MPLDNDNCNQMIMILVIYNMQSHLYKWFFLSMAWSWQGKDVSFFCYNSSKWMRLVSPIGLEKFLTFSYLLGQTIYFFFGGRVLFKIKYIGPPSIQGSPPSDCSGCSQGHKTLAIIPLLLTTGSPSASGVLSVTSTTHPVVSPTAVLTGHVK